MTSRANAWRGVCLAAGLLAWFAWMCWSTPEATAPAVEPSPRAAGRDVAVGATAQGPSGVDQRRGREGIAGPQPGLVGPASLRDTEVDGRLATDVHGRLIIDRELRRLFDYLLAGASEQPIDLLRARLRDLAAAQGGEALATEALEAFDQYLSYLRAEAELGRRQSDDLQARLDALIALRRRALGAATAEAYFGEEERYAQATLDRAQDADPAWSAARRDATEHQRALEQTTQFEQLDLDAAQRWEERETLYGAEAADRLAELDAQQAQWDARLQDWAARRAALQAEESMSPEQREQAISTLFESMFDEAERRRVQALEGEGG